MGCNLLLLLLDSLVDSVFSLVTVHCKTHVLGLGMAVGEVFGLNLNNSTGAEWCDFRLRRLPPAYVARGLSSGRAMLEEVQVSKLQTWYSFLSFLSSPCESSIQAWVSRMSRVQSRRQPSGPSEAGKGPRRFIACVVSDEQDLLAELPCSSLTGVDIVWVSSDS